ncbi:hypothetical protein [Streptomyces sp. RK9]|uniref:hypothetical protein n=1 Tax=Streptomyces sp. RK9 TaxID=3239284 RepID=UPI00386624D8
MYVKQAIGVAAAAVTAAVALTITTAAEQDTPDTRAASGAAATLAQPSPLTGEGTTGNWPPPHATERGNWPPPQFQTQSQTGNWPPPKAQTTQTGNWPPPQSTHTGNWPPPQVAAAIGA